MADVDALRAGIASLREQLDEARADNIRKVVQIMAAMERLEVLMALHGNAMEQLNGIEI
ncbi:hypothetical protein PHYSODRAFT_323516 [Phytophthora sojae]|uniref:Uncharacterized protein n=1 Tax=Phytophthora sojae (strain P6497) TaxID=1094619 RepID=G4YNB3_PHYSP|nr:hypothetical protein PHYSODRAFT_323516 [Phytophthora sojae]EGZ30066.1 hypothetical protein PHYSODRAFT_323516 [Phytophthora sojae]|eukprot:XP_009517341.1 hypothetical protein PHYSODRAFT_323516 [Phytophthora sojae]